MNTSELSPNNNHLKKIKKYKLVLLGEQSVGKTSLITRFMYDSFNNSYQATVGIDFLSKTLCMQDKTVRFQLWDTAGQERFRSLIPSYIRDSNVALIVYDVTNQTSFEQTTRWIKDVQLERGDNVTIVLVGNKVDLHGSRQVTHDDGKLEAHRLGVMFTETSARNGYNVRHLFSSIAESLPKTSSDKDLQNFRNVILENKMEGSTQNNQCIC